MAKIISLHKAEKQKCSSRNVEELDNIIEWISDMNDLIGRIEKSLAKTQTYVEEDINSRG